MGESTSDFIKHLYFEGETFSLEPAEQTFTMVKQSQKKIAYPVEDEATTEVLESTNLMVLYCRKYFAY